MTKKRLSDLLKEEANKDANSAELPAEAEPNPGTNSDTPPLVPESESTAKPRSTKAKSRSTAAKSSAAARSTSTRKPPASRKAASPGQGRKPASRATAKSPLATPKAEPEPKDSAPQGTSPDPTPPQTDLEQQIETLNQALQAAKAEKVDSSKNDQRPAR
ncbi:MAG: hypothetical protein HC922_04445 [Leptolyngbyaceae cyanobacterium SM2_3_12]|nr:hypothetical protein [Leptolyngbyaceae cyanobacterium SM2_3_12]